MNYRNLKRKLTKATKTHYSKHQVSTQIILGGIQNLLRRKWDVPFLCSLRRIAMPSAQSGYMGLKDNVFRSVAMQEEANGFMASGRCLPRPLNCQTGMVSFLGRCQWVYIKTSWGAVFKLCMRRSCKSLFHCGNGRGTVMLRSEYPLCICSKSLRVISPSNGSSGLCSLE